MYASSGTGRLPPASLAAGPGSQGLRRIFISYSHLDRDILDEVLVHLRPLSESYQIESWSDQQIGIGNDFPRSIEAAIYAADFAVLLVSATFLASDFIRNFELPKIVEASNLRGLRLLVFLVSPCSIEHSELRNMQAVHDTKTSLRELDKLARDKIFVGVATTIAALLDEAPSNHNSISEASDHPPFVTDDETRALVQQMKSDDTISGKNVFVPGLFRMWGRPIIQSKTFVNCNLVGPAVIAPKIHFTLSHCTLIGSAGPLGYFLPSEIMPDRNISGAIGFANVSLIKCRIFLICFVIQQEFIDRFVRSLQKNMQS